MSNLPKVLSSEAKIRFPDCDPFNHLNNGSYMDYFMNHRDDVLIENYDIDIYKMAFKIGKSWVSSTNQIAYLKPALLSEKVIIESKVIAFTNSELQVEMCMYNKDKSHLKAILWSGFVHYNLKNQKRDTHSKDLMQLFKSVVIPVKENTFEERLKEIKSFNLTKEV